MARVLMEIRRPGKAPTAEEIKAEYGLSDGELDTGYGVVLVDPRDGTYAIMVEQSAVEKVNPAGGAGSHERGHSGIEARGPYSNSRIEPTGPPRSSRDPAGE